MGDFLTALRTLEQLKTWGLCFWGFPVLLLKAGGEWLSLKTEGVRMKAAVRVQVTDTRGAWPALPS